MNKFLYILLAAGFLGACNGNNPEPRMKSFVEVSGIDSSIKPGDNFFRYVNGRWYDTAKIADDQTGVGSYMFLNIPQKKLLQNILDNTHKKHHHYSKNNVQCSSIVFHFLHLDKQLKKLQI